MPIFEYSCGACGHGFSVLVFSSSKEKEITCPSCSAKEVKKQVSSFACPLPSGGGGGGFPTGGG